MSVMKTYAKSVYWPRDRRGVHQDVTAKSSSRQTGKQETYTNPHHLVHTAAGCFEDGFQIAAALGRLLGDGTLDQIALGVGGDLAGTPDLAGGFDGLAVWSCCCWWEGGRVSKW
jgi:hypothetical protein